MTREESAFSSSMMSSNHSANASLTAQIDQLSLGNQQDKTDTAPSELVGAVDDLLNQLNSKFSNLSSELIGKMDEMSRRLDNLEANIQAGNAQQAAADSSK